MAYRAGNDKQEVIALIEKNSKGEYFQISRIIPEDKNKLESVDIRIMYTTAEDEIRPTSKGIRANSEAISEVVAAILKSLKQEELDEAMELFESNEDGGDEEDSE